MRSIHHPLSIFVPLSAARLHSAGHLLGTYCLPARSPEPLMACQPLGSSCQAGLHILSIHLNSQFEGELRTPDFVPVSKGLCASYALHDPSSFILQTVVVFI